MNNKEEMTRYLPRPQLQSLLDLLEAEGYDCLGPQPRDGAIVFDTLRQISQLPAGLEDRQAPGRYRLEEGGSPRHFAWANGPQALKPLLFAPRERLWRVERSIDGQLRFTDSTAEPQKRAVIGVRACDLAALRLQDQHFLHGAYHDEYYGARRKGLLLIAVNCSHPAETCFCHSTGDGPSATQDFDLVMDELEEGYLIEAGSEAGSALLQQLDLEEAEPIRRQEAETQRQQAVQGQGRHIASTDLRETLFARLNHPRWEDVAERCLACGNCTAVCPTCFCHSEHDVPKLDGSESEHVREWDSCFTQGHSYIHGVTIREETRLRYRQWLTHKLAGWHDQYGRSGCVGCGRCISWCPVGIDLTEEVAALCKDEAEADA